MMSVTVEKEDGAAQDDSAEMSDLAAKPDAKHPQTDSIQQTRTKRLMGHLIGTLIKSKDELNAKAPLLVKRTQLEEQASLKRKAIEEQETSRAIKLKQKRVEEEKVRREKEKEQRIREQEAFEQSSLKDMEIEWERHHGILSKFFITKLPPPAVNIYYKPKRLL